MRHAHHNGFHSKFCWLVNHLFHGWDQDLTPFEAKPLLTWPLPGKKAFKPEEIIIIIIIIIIQDLTCNFIHLHTKSFELQCDLSYQVHFPYLLSDVSSKEQLQMNCRKFFGLTFEKVEEFKYMGKTLTKQNSMQVEIKSRMKQGNTCYHSV